MSQPRRASLHAPDPSRRPAAQASFWWRLGGLDTFVSVLDSLVLGSILGRVTGRARRFFSSLPAVIALMRSAGLVALDLLPPLRRQLAHLLMFGVRD